MTNTENNLENNINENVEKILKTYDREANVRIWKGLPRFILKYLLAAFSIYCILINFLFHFETRINRASFVGCIVFFIFMLYPARKHGGSKLKTNYIPWYDIVLAVLAAFSYFYFVFNCQNIINMGMRITPFMMIVGVIGIITTLEACRRASGVPIVIVTLFFLIYAFVFSGKKFGINIYNIFFTADGVLGTPIRACSTFIVLFVIFGAFLEKTSISAFFIDLANSIAGSSSGGPAKVAVISSALCGMVSGSSVGNTVTTGAVTIPLMKKNGYRPEFAGAVEAAASTGGQIMPPIMGAAAFLMVEYTGETYTFILLRACLPALLYFAGIFIAVHLEAKKAGLKGLNKENLPKFGKIFLSKWYLLLPLIVLTYLIITRTMTLAAIVATILSILLANFDKKTRMNFDKIVDGLESGARSTITVGIACALAGIIACVITTTGIGTVLISGIVSLANGRLIVGMLLTMITCIILGMGVPTTANYVIMATTCAPILIAMGMNPFAAHMFVFYFGIVADITPPVALAAYAGSAIAGASPMKTAINASLLAIAAFIVPFVFGLNPSLLFVDPSIRDAIVPIAFSPQIILIIITSLLGIFGIAAGIRGYCFTDMNPLERVIILLGGLLLVDPSILTDIFGFILIVFVLLVNKFLPQRLREEI